MNSVETNQHVNGAVRKSQKELSKTHQRMTLSKLNSWLKVFKERFKSESGSAIVEFVALAIPLFIPVFIYLNHFSSVSANEEIARSMAREVLRVYVISEDDFEARTLSSKASKLLARQWHLTDWELVTLELKLDCSHTPCLSANGRVKLTVRYTDEETGRVVSASAQEHLSPWL